MTTYTNNKGKGQLSAEAQQLLLLEYARRKLRERADPANQTAKYWRPRSRPQKMALTSKADRLFYGGSAGGGKTDLLIGAATTQHKKSIIFRREFPQLTDVIIRAEEILEGTGAKYNQTRHIWKNIPGRRTLEFGAIQHEKHKINYRGRAHDFKGFDEITEFSRTQFEFVIAWTRSTIPGQRTRVICTGNPPSSTQGRWVVRYWSPWLDEDHPDYPARAGELRWFATIDGEDREVDSTNLFTYKGMAIKPHSRTFIPASLSDNPFLRDTDYASTVNSLPEPLRSQLLFGLFNVKGDENPWQVLPTAWVEASMRRWREQGGYTQRLSSIGFDVARGGRDRTSIALKYGNYFPPLHRVPGTTTHNGETAAREVLVALGLNPDAWERASFYGNESVQVPINIDVIGIGASAYDIMVKTGFNIYPVNFSVPTTATDHSTTLKLLNLRAEAYWKLREAIDPGLGGTLMLPDDNELKEELLAATWEVRPQGIKIEDKDAIKQRLGRSPDGADSVALAMLDMAAKKGGPTTTSQSHRQYTGGSITVESHPSNLPLINHAPYGRNPYQEHPNSHGQRVRTITRSDGSTLIIPENI